MRTLGRDSSMRRVTGLAALATLALLLSVTSAQAGGGSRIFGLNYAFNGLTENDAGKLAQSGAQTVRWTFSWPRIETSQGHFDWSAADKVVGDLAARGIRVLPTLYGSPSWVEGSVDKPPIDSQPARLAWQRFVKAAVDRYGPTGTFWTIEYPLSHPMKPALPIGTWQIWNEPNLRSHFAPRPSPGGYARLLTLSNGAIKEQDPAASVMFAGMPGYSNDINAWQFLRRVYQKPGTEQAFDIAALHPYARNVDQMLGEIRHFRKVMRKHGDDAKPLWITEIGWGSAPPSRYGLTKGKKGQVRILKHAFRALRKKSDNWHIGQVLWFNFRDPDGPAHGCSFCSSAGLLKSDLKPKPAWSAFRSFSR
jgi:polysaccharide biosynthesis protein PslG